MPRRLTLAQRLARPDGSPATVTRFGLAAAVCLAFAGGYAADSGSGARHGAAPAIPVERLTGDLPSPPAEDGPQLGRAAALPQLVQARRTRPARRRPPAVVVPVRAAPTPDPTPAPTPVAEPPAPVVAPSPPPPPPRPAAPAPRPAPPTQTFDSSG